MLDLSKIITIRVSQDMWNDLGRIADSEEVKLSTQIRRILTMYMDKRKLEELKHTHK